MPERLGNGTLRLSGGPWVSGWASSVGKKETEGPLGGLFDQCHTDDSLGQQSWEKAESLLLKEAAHLALRKAKLQPEEIDCVFAGDLLNQCAASVFGLRGLEIPFLGQYGACSTMAQTLAMAAVFVEAGAARRARWAVTSSHFCSAERQFRLPLEYGGQRTPHRAVDGHGGRRADPFRRSAGGHIAGDSRAGRAVRADHRSRRARRRQHGRGPWRRRLPPRSAAIFADTGAGPQDFDLILTGDLGAVGSDLLRGLMLREGWDISPMHNDGGLMLFDRAPRRTCTPAAPAAAARPRCCAPPSCRSLRPAA